MLENGVCVGDDNNRVYGEAGTGGRRGERGLEGCGLACCALS